MYDFRIRVYDRRMGITKIDSIIIKFGSVIIWCVMVQAKKSELQTKNQSYSQPDSWNPSRIAQKR